MAHIKDDEVYPIGTVVRLKKTGEFALIIGQAFLKDNKYFLHYEARIEGRRHSSDKSHYALYHDEIELEALPPTQTPS